MRLRLRKRRAECTEVGGRPEEHVRLRVLEEGAHVLAPFDVEGRRVILEGYVAALEADGRVLIGADAWVCGELQVVWSRARRERVYVL